MCKVIKSYLIFKSYVCVFNLYIEYIINNLIQNIDEAPKVKEVILNKDMLMIQ